MAKVSAAKRGTSGTGLTIPRWPRTGVVVADGGSARLMLASRGHRVGAAVQLEQITSLQNPAAHLPGRALVTDRTGRVFDSGGRTGHGPKSRARHGAQSDYDPHHVEVQRFAKRLAKLLEVERRHLGIEELVVIAAPAFLGVLRPQLAAATRKVVTREIDRDLVRASDALIRRTAFATRH